MPKRAQPDTLLFALALAVTATIHLPSVAHGLVADSFVFAVPHTLAETFRYFAVSVIPPEHNALWLRPIPMFTFRLDGFLWNYDAWGMHLTNVLIHLVNVALVWRLIRRSVEAAAPQTLKGKESAPLKGPSAPLALSTGPLAPFAGALIYGIHPLSVGSASWVAARFDLLSIAFGLAGLTAWLGWTKVLSGRRLAGAVLLLALSLLSKEQGIVFIAACGAVSAYEWATNRTHRERPVLGLTLLAATLVVYGFWRVLAFGGLGGYLDAPQHGLSIVPPLSYLVTLAWPFVTPLLIRTVTVPFLLALAGLAAAGAILIRTHRGTIPHTGRAYLVAFGAVFLFGLATTLPNPALTFRAIIRHSEARFALPALTGLALLAGPAVRSLLRRRAAYIPVAVALLVWFAALAWRADVQRQAWGSAAVTAGSIVTQTLALAPDPPTGSMLIYIDIPRENAAYAYIYGIGLEEAVKAAYGRADIRVVRYPTREDFRKADPARDAVFEFHPETGELERLKAE